MRPVPGDGALPATIARRALALIYEALLLIAVVFIGSLPFVMFVNVTDHGVTRLLFQLYLVALTGFYFSWQWHRGGQTLAMKTWRMRVVTRAGSLLTRGHAQKRYAFAQPGTLLFGAGFLWALVDREGLFLHDRLAGTKIIMNDE